MACNADLDGKTPSYFPSRDIFSSFTNIAVIGEFLKRDGFCLIIVVGGFLVARSYNNYLDKLEVEEYNQELKKRKLEGTYVSSDESDSDQDVKVNKVPKVEKKMHRPPLNPID